MNKNFNIQLFAENLNTTATMSKEMKTFYEKRLIDQAEPRLVHDQFADYYPVPQNGGKTIEFRKYDSLPKASTPLTEGVTPNGQALNVTTITSDLHQYGGWTPLTDVLQMTAIDNNVVQATRVLASQAGRTMDSITRDVLAGGTNVIYAPKLGADGTETAVTSRKALDKSCTLHPSKAVEGCDIYDKQGKIYVVSDGTARHHLLDVSTTIRQIAGRIRDTRYKEITHISSTVRYAEGITYPQFKAATEKELDKAERFVK